MKTRRKSPPQRISEYFNVNAASNRLEFVDIYVSDDLPVFLDPYGISAMGTKWSKECEEEIASYFQYLIDCIQVGNASEIKKLLDALHEAKEIGLGFSRSGTKGRGIGPKQAAQIQRAFEKSKAGQSGDIKDIADCALMIPGINRDKISDITANILKKKLIEFTQVQCRKHKIPMERTPINNVFHLKDFAFRSYFDELPVVSSGEPKIFLPISSVRHTPELSKDKYYRNFVLEFLRAEHEHAGDSLSQILRNGRVVVRVKDLKVAYPMSADFLHDFSVSNPQVLENYKKELRRSAGKFQNVEPLKVTRKVLTALERRDILKGIESGAKAASAFHKLAFDNLIEIFGDRLANPLMEREINQGRKRIDIVFDNVDQRGFFNRLNVLHHVKCPKIMVECKNYKTDISNPELDQLAARLTPRRGRFGIVVCREIADEKRLLDRCRDFTHEDKYILVLKDNEINLLLEARERQDETFIDDFFERKFDDLIM